MNEIENAINQALRNNLTLVQSDFWQFMVSTQESYHICRYIVIVWVSVVLRRTVCDDIDWRSQVSGRCPDQRPETYNIYWRFTVHLTVMMTSAPVVETLITYLGWANQNVRKTIPNNNNSNNNNNNTQYQ